MFWAPLSSVSRPTGPAFAATVSGAKADLFAQFVMMTPFPGTVDFERWEKSQAANPTYRWRAGESLLADPGPSRPKLYFPHPNMSG